MLIDEGHDVETPWLKLAAQMVDPATNSLLLLCDDAQSIYAWGDMVITCRHYTEMERCAAVLRHRQLPHEVRKGSGTFHPLADTIKILTMHASKGLEFPVVAVSGAGHMPEDGHDETEEARLFYVAATRATQRLIIPLSGSGKFAARLAAAAT